MGRTQRRAQGSSQSLVQRSARNRALNIPEILETILWGMEDRDVLINAQRVSKRWQATIMGSPKIQASLFLRGIPRSLNAERYTKNHLVAYFWPKLFNATLFPYGSYPGHTKSSFMTLDEIRTSLDYGIREVWLVENASWRQMLVSQPPITKIHWQVRREDLEDPQVPLPSTVAEFNFPDGLRMGDYYDLVLGTRCYHEIIWPNAGPGYGRRDYRNNDNPAEQWEHDEMRRAYGQRAILIRQRVHEESLGLYFKRHSFWNQANLHVYHRNLTSLKKLELEMVNGNVVWKYKTHGTDQSSAMEIFLRDAQDPVPYMSY
ncbi:hypothetical protein F4814DRAFT_203605 [Daldinia grandis]|nr:hypothetical protein F4814DRAFT_203605 [Daldinia grandis]